VPSLHGKPTHHCSSSLDHLTAGVMAGCHAGVPGVVCSLR